MQQLCLVKKLKRFTARELGHLPFVFVYLASDVGRRIGQYAALAFLGLGAETSRPDWGAMLFEYRGFMFEHATLLLWPGLAIVVTVLTLHVAIEPHWGQHQRRGPTAG